LALDSRLRGNERKRARPYLASPALSAVLASPPGLTRGSILFAKKLLRRRWIAGSSPAMTNPDSSYYTRHPGARLTRSSCTTHCK
jgi:hypothetical protein